MRLEVLQFDLADRQRHLLFDESIELVVVVRRFRRRECRHCRVDDLLVYATGLRDAHQHVFRIIRIEGHRILNRLLKCLQITLMRFLCDLHVKVEDVGIRLCGCELHIIHRQLLLRRLDDRVLRLTFADLVTTGGARVAEDRTVNLVDIHARMVVTIQHHIRVGHNVFR
ncbi:hypothetical protein D3C76_759390 [compost metagenome]